MAAIVHLPRASDAGIQDSLPRRYGLGVQLLSLIAFTLAFVGWLNETKLLLFENPVWLNRYTEYAIILGFGVWRIAAEKNRYTRKRLAVLVLMVTGVWWLIPWLTPFFEPFVGFVWTQPVFPALHVPGTITFFLVLAAVLLFGRRVICGWNCPCVGIRETVGFAFRDRTVRGAWAWRLRHSKWFFFLLYVGVMVVTQYPPNSWTVSFVGLFYLIVAVTYFGTFFIAPLTGNRFYCRFLCPYGATFGLLNHAGFYGIRMDGDQCNDCRRCEQVCDMGIPVWAQGRASGRITGIEDCMGCGRCVVSCPTDALEIRDVRNLWRPGLVQNGSYLMKRPLPAPVARHEPPARLPGERLGDSREIHSRPTREQIQAQASRCLDCGVPGCREGCPLGNRIPDWMQATAQGDFAEAATLMHATNPLPEVCGRLCPQHRLCEGACTRARDGSGAVTIGAVERWVTDSVLDAGRRGDSSPPNWTPPPAKARTGRRVAVVGAGPAGLACADYLNRAGCSVTVFDRSKAAGGLLAHGVPPFKLEPSILERRVGLLERSGVEFRMGAEVDRETMRSLVETSDAVFLATGTTTARDVPLPGCRLPEVVPALEYLGQSVHWTARRVVVLGAGDTAMDCARTARRAGADVAVCARAAEPKLRASPREATAAREEGVTFHFQHEPLEILGRDAVRGVRFRTPEGERTLECDAVVIAAGFVARPPEWAGDFGIETDDQGRIRVDARGRTSHPKIWAGGDAARGPDLVVTALADGRRVAEALLARGVS